MTEQHARPAIAGIVLAGGESSRLGEPKQLLQLDGQPLILRVVLAALDRCSAGVVVVTGAVHAGIDAALADTPAVVVRNRDWREGIGASIRRGVAAVDADADALLLLVCDQPHVGAGQLDALLDAWSRAPDKIAAAGYSGVRGVPAVFPARCRASLAALRGDRGARRLIDAAAQVTVVDMPEAAFDVDTPQDAGRLGD